MIAIARALVISALPICAAASSSDTPAPNLLSNAAFIARVKQSTSTLSGVISEDSKMVFRNLKLLRTSNGRRVCGEIKDDVDDEWTRFYNDLDSRGAELEPHVGFDDAVFAPFKKQCDDAVRRLPKGAKGRPEDIRACAAAGLAAEASFQRARFDLLYQLSCEEKLWPLIERSEPA